MSNKKQEHDRELMSIANVTLREPRDKSVWTKDPKVKEAKKNLDNSQHGTNYLLSSYTKSAKYLRSNLHVTVGRQRL